MARNLEAITGMKPDERRLVRHLAVAVAVKLCVLGVLWWAFVRDAGVSADSEQTAAHIAVTARPQGVSR